MTKDFRTSTNQDLEAFLNEQNNQSNTDRGAEASSIYPALPKPFTSLENCENINMGDSQVILDSIFSPNTHTTTIDPVSMTRKSQLARDIASNASLLLIDTVGLEGSESEVKKEREAVALEMLTRGAPTPPDGGYGWVIVGVSFLCNLILDGITCTFGILLPQMVIDFRAGKGEVAWAGSLFVGISLCVGPLVSACTNKFGCRPVCICGGIIGSIGFIISSFSNTLALLLVSYGIIGAIGYGLIYLPNIVSVGYYFEKRRALATGIAVCGSGFGATFFPPLTTWLIEVTTWRYVNFFYAILIFLCGVSGIFIKPLELKREAMDDYLEERVLDPDPNKRPLLYRIAEDKRRQRSASESNEFNVQLPDGTIETRIKKAPVNADPGVHSTLYLMEDHIQSPKLPNDPTISSGLSTIVEKRDGFPDSHGISEIPEGFVQDSFIKPLSRSTSKNSAHNKAYSIENRHDSNQGMSQDFEDLDLKTPLSTDQAFFSPQVTGPGPIRAVPVPLSTPKISSIFGSIASRRNSQMSCSHDLIESMESVGCNNGTRRGILGSQISGNLRNESVTSFVQRIVRPLSRKDVFYSGSITQLPEYEQSCYRQKILCLPKEMNASFWKSVDGNVPESEGQETEDLDTIDHTSRQDHVGFSLDFVPSQQVKKPVICPSFRKKAGAFVTALRNFMDFSLLKNPIFLLIAVSGVIGMLGFFIPFVFIIDYCHDKGIESDEAAILISVVGFMNIIGRVGFGMLSDLPFISSLYLNNLCLLGLGICAIFVPICNDLVSLIIDYIFFGLFVAGYSSLTSIMLVDLLGIDNLTNAFGLLILFRGSASIVGSPLAGFLYDIFQSYEIPFFLAGAFLILSSCVSSAIPCVSKWRIHKQTCQNSPSQKPIVQPHPLEDIPESLEPFDRLDPSSPTNEA